MRDERTTYRRVLEWGCERMLKAQSIEDAQETWESFPVLHSDWVFVGIKDKMKKELSNQKSVFSR